MMEVESKIFKIKNRKNLEIVGNISLPKESIGVSFVLHGLGGFKEQNHIKAIEDTLAEKKYTVVNFDATNSIGESEGKYQDATMQNHYEDLVDVISWSKNQNWYKEPFIIAGHSLGGFAVAKYAEEYPQQVKGVFPFAAVFSGEDSFEAHNRFFHKELEEWKRIGFKSRISNSKHGVELILPWSHMEERLKHDLRPMAYKIIMPILFVVGENDESCPHDHQKKFYDLLPSSTKKEFYIIKGAPHTFRDSKHLEELKSFFSNWLSSL